MKCAFCKRDLPKLGHVTYVKSNGDILRFCSSKCHKSFLMGRDPRRKKWVTKQEK